VYLHVFNFIFLENFTLNQSVIIGSEKHEIDSVSHLILDEQFPRVNAHAYGHRPKDNSVIGL
jgi:hypothetical protein